MHLPWVEFVINEKGGVHQVRCKICIDVEGKEKLLAPNLDNLLKHVGSWKCLVYQQMLMLVHIISIKIQCI
jgi:hypothetical protein